jgi:4'-phosphopantetheinyl transferase
MNRAELRPSGPDLIALPPIAPGIACWQASLVVTPARLRAAHPLLSELERARVARFGTAELRERYIVGRAALRRVLGDRLGTVPAAIDIRRGHRGRPFVEDATGIDFNVSHTRDIALIAVAERVRVGVDIEHEQRATNADGLARKFMTERERAALAPFDEEARRRRFLRAWTCKEAMSKATGDGIGAPFRQIDVDVDRLQHIAGPPPYAPGAWQLHALRGVPGYIATVAIWTGFVEG